MKNTRVNRFKRNLSWSTMVCIAAASSKALAATYFVSSGSTVSTSPVDLSQAANYTTGIAPGTGDVAQISTAQVSTGTNYFTYSTNASIGQLCVDLASGTATGGSETITSANTLTLNSIGALGVTTGGILLNGSTGATLILNENVQLGATQFFTNLRAVTIGGNIDLDGFNLYTDTVGTTSTYTGTISDSTGNLTTGITASGTGQLILSGSNTYAGGTTLGSGGGATGGFVRVMNNSALGTGPVTFAGNYTLGTNIGGAAITLANNLVINSGITANFDGGYANLTLNGNISGGGIVNKVSTGFVTFGGTNTYTGGTTLAAGFTTFASTAAIPTTGTINVQSGAALIDTGAYTTVEGFLNSGSLLSTSAGSIALTGNSSETISFASPSFPSLGLSATGTFTYSGALTPGTNGYEFGGPSPSNLTVSSNLTAAKPLIKTGTGSLILTGTNSYTGLTTLAGTLVIATPGSSNYTGGFTVQSGATLNVSSGTAVNAGSGVITIQAGNLIVNGNLTTAAGISIGTNTGGSITVGSGAVLTVGTWTNGWSTNYTINGTVNVTNASQGSVVAIDATEAWSGTGTFNISSYGLANFSTVNSSVNLNDMGNFLLGNASSQVGNLNQTAGTINVTTSTAGSIRLGHWAGETSTLTLGGTSVFNALNSATSVGWDGNGVINIVGGTANLKQLSYAFSGHSGLGTVNLISGNLNLGTGGIIIGGSPASTTFNLSGGTLGSIAGSGGWSSSLPMTATTGTTSQINTSGGNITLSGIISGAGGIIDAGTGVFTLSGSNAYTGNTTVAGPGKLYVKGSLGSSSIVTVNSGGVLGGLGVINGLTNVSGGGILEAGQLGVGSLTLNSLSIPGSASLNIGTLAGYSTTPAFNVTGNGLFDPGTSTGGIAVNVASLNGATAGTYELLEYTGANTDNQLMSQYTLSPLPSRTTGSLSNVYNSGTGIGFIDLTIGSSGSAYITWTGQTNALWDTSAANVNWNLSSGGTTTFQTGDQVVFQDGPTNTTLNIDTANVSVSSMTFNNNTSTYSITGAFGIGGATGLTMNGSGTVVLATSNAFTGPVMVNAGILSVQNNNAVGASSGVTVSSGATLQLSGGISTGVGIPLTIGGPGATNQSGSLVNVAGNNLYGGPLTLSIDTTFSVQAGSMNLSSSALINGNGYNLTLDGVAGTTGVLGGALNTGSGTVTKTGLGTWVMSGASAYTGLTNVTAGTLIVSGGTNREVNYTVATGATLDLAYSSGGGYTGGVILNGDGVGNTSAGVFLLPGITFQTNAGFVIQNAPATITTYGGIGVATLGGFDVNTTLGFLDCTAAASGSVVSSTINFNTESYGYVLNVASGSNNSTGDLTIAGSIGGTGTANSAYYAGANNFEAGLVTIGNGSLLLTGSSTYSSGTEITNGTVFLGVNNALPVASTVQLGLGSNSGQLVLNGVNQTISGLLTSGSGSSNAVMGNSATPSTLTVNYNVSGGTDTFTGTLGGTTANQSNFGLTLKGVGTLVLSGLSNTYSGGTVVTAGTLTGTTIAAFGTGDLLINPTGTAGNSNDTATVNTSNSLAITANVTVNTNSGSAVGTLNFNGNAEQIGSLAGTGNVVLNNGGGTALTVGNNFNTTFSGNITDVSGNGSLTKVGAGVLTLSGNNSWGGPTSVNAGTLVITQTSALPTNGNNTMLISTGATLVLDSQTTESNIPSVNINGNLIVHGGSFSTLDTAVQNASNNGWASVGNGIYSSAAAADPTYLTALGVIQNDNGTGSGIALYSTFEGQSVSDSDVLVKYTYYGDTNLDGKVDGTDYSRVDATYLAEDFNNGAATNPISGWFNGDFNYDGVVDGSDYTLMDNAYNNQGAQFTAAVATAQIAGTSAVPEPTTLGLLGIGAVGLLGRRGRKSPRRH